MTEERESLPTLGERLDAQGRGLAVRLLPSLPWAGPLQVLVGRAIALTAPFDGRFERIESSPDGVEPHRSVAGGGGARPRAPAVRWPEVVASTSATAPADGPGERPVAGRPLPADVRSRLRDVVGRGADVLRVHDDDEADALARAHRADAVTVGRDVYFRAGRFRPREERGFGLLAHEATHVLALLRPGADWRRATGGGVRDEEQDALTQERAAVRRDVAPVRDRETRALALHPASGWPAATAGTAPPGALPVATAPAPAARPMTATPDRDTSPPSPSPLDLEALRRDLLNDLMRRLRTDFERGG